MNRNIFIRLLCLYILFIPNFFYHFVDLRITQEGVYQMATLTMIACSFFIPWKSRIIIENKWAIVFCLFMIANYIYYNFYTGANVLMNFFLGFVLYYCLSQILGREDIRPIFKAIIGVCIINLVYIGAQTLLPFDPIYRQEGDITGTAIEPVGLLGMKACVGMYYAMAIPIFAYFFPLLPVLCLYPLYISVSSVSTVAAPVVWLFYLWYKFRILFFIVCPLLIAASIWYIIKVDNPMGMQTSRLTMWKSAISVALKKPITGWGLDSFRKVWNDSKEKDKGKDFAFYRIDNNELKDKNIIFQDGMKIEKDSLQGPIAFWDNPHNEYLQIIFEMGIPAFVIVVMFLIQLYKRFKNAVKSKEFIAVTGSLVALCLCGLTQFPFHLARIGYIFPILLALFMITSSREEQKEASVEY